ncbi:MAG TPA: DUF456 domain-containing protein [Anaeromyxobacteraceae bacterium]|nr:DUF456 domain-containing protein [Anaeromyxobacteraceae bacterium]
MATLLYVLGVLALLVGLAGIVLPGLPGSLLLVAGVFLVGWAGHFAVVGWGTIAVAAALGIAIAAVDWLAGIMGARAFGASKWAMVGGAVGLLVGFFFGLPGVLLGPAVGAFAFELAKDPNLKQAAKSGVGALLGFVVGSVVKVAFAFFLLGVLALAFVL